MIDEQVWHVDGEGSLARTWEQRLKPKTEPRVVRRRVPAPWLKTVGWIASLWTGAAVASVLAVHVMTMSYQYDQLNQHYASLTRQNQQLQMSLASMTSAASLAQDARKLKVTLVQPMNGDLTSAPIKPVSKVSSRHGVLAHITGWMQNLSHALGQ